MMATARIEKKNYVNTELSNVCSCYHKMNLLNMSSSQNIIEPPSAD